MSLNLAVLVSGRGSNLKAILQAITEGRLDAKVQVVLSNDPKAPALQIAQDHGVPAIAIPSAKMERGAHEEAVLAQLKAHNFDFVVLAGYMRVLSPTFLKQFKDPEGFFRIINIHPSLLPSFPGKQAYEDAFTHGVKLSGVTIHLVDENVDHGPILAQEVFRRLPNDTLAMFKARGLAIEHNLYPAVLQQIAKYGISGMILKSQQAVET